MAGAGQIISKLWTFFTKYVSHSTMSILEKRSHMIRPVEVLELRLDFFPKVGIELGKKGPKL